MHLQYLTEHKSAEFGMFDYIQLHRGDKIGYMPAVTSVTQVTDVTKEPDAEIHTNIAMTSAIEHLNLLGCNVKSSPSSKLFPIYDAPSEEMLDKIRANLDAFTSRYNLALRRLQLTQTRPAVLWHKRFVNYYKRSPYQIRPDRRRNGNHNYQQVWRPFRS